MTSEQPDGVNRLKAHNLMQIELAKGYYGFEIADEQLSEWIVKYSTAFRKAVEENPDFIDRYAVGNKEQKGAILEEIGHLIYVEETSIK